MDSYVVQGVAFSSSVLAVAMPCGHYTFEDQLEDADEYLRLHLKDATTHASLECSKCRAPCCYLTLNDLASLHLIDIFHGDRPLRRK
jgi:hypothetical protein